MTTTGRLDDVSFSVRQSFKLNDNFFENFKVSQNNICYLSINPWMCYRRRPTSLPRERVCEEYTYTSVYKSNP